MLNTLINDRYMIESELGRGGMGIVYRAHDTLLERDVAVKLLATGSLGSQGRARLLREAQAAARLNHPNIINIFDAGDANGSSYIIMELLDGELLYEHKPANLEEVLDIFTQICDALEHAHQHGIIHRDLKPENVIVTSSGVAKLTDFGLSRSISARVSQEGIIVGTVYYLAPEQALRQDIDSRADLYALGVLMYEMVAGRLPFTADDPLGVISQHINAPVVPPSTYNADIPPALDGIILRLMNKRPEDRPSTAGEVREALKRLNEAPEAFAAEYLTGLSPLDRLARGRLVGRQEEFNRIKKLWRQVMAAGSTAAATENVLVISGEAGVGKTPLVKEIRSLAQVSGGRVLQGTGYARESAPYAPIVQIIHEAEPLPEALPDLVVGDLMSLSPDLAMRSVPVNAPLSPLSEQQRLFESLFALFATFAERQPLLLILEDAHWADGNTLFLLRHLARRARVTHLKLLIVLTYRPGEIDEGCCNLEEVLLDLEQERLSVTINLQPFSREQTRELLATMGLETVSDPFVDSIYKVTEGNLFFIEEICKALIEEGFLACDNGQWHFSGIEELELPQSVRVALQVRLNRLPPEAQDVLRLAALIGREFDYEVLRQACENPNEETLIDSLELAERAQLISEVHAKSQNGHPAIGPNERFTFAHTLIPTTLKEEISSLRRRRLHRRIANAIENVYPDDLEKLAYHYGLAGNQDKARQYTILAGDRARRLYANAEALRFYNEALQLTAADHPDRFHILAARAQVYEVLAQRDLQQADIEMMLELAEQQDDDTLRCDALIALADMFLLTEAMLTREPAEKAVEIARRLQDPVREGRALRCAGWGAWARHDYHVSCSALETAVARFRQAGMLAQAAECLHMLSLVTGMQGLGEQEVSQKFAEDAIQLSRLAGDPRQEAISLRRLAIVYMDRLELDQALQICQEALNLHRELGDRHEECMALNAVGVILAWLRRFDEASEHFRQSFELSKVIHSSMGFWMVFANMQWFCFRREGRYEDGLAFIEEQFSLSEVQKDAYLYANLLVLKAELLYQLGQYVEALSVLRQVTLQSERLFGTTAKALLLVFIAEIESSLHHFSEAEAAMHSAWELAPKIERPNDLALVYLRSAEIAWREWETGNLKQLDQAAAQI